MYYVKTDENGYRCIVKDMGNSMFVVFPDGAQDNTDYQAYLKWLEEGNTPEPAEEQ